MNLVLFAHPPFLGLRSQAHFARMLADAYRQRGHTVDLRHPHDTLHRRWPAGRSAKWAGYADQYLLFPGQMRRAMRHDPPHTLYVFCDQALGPWVPHAAHRPHVVHCHDLLALRSALGEVPENPTSATGRIYQRYIRRGFGHARHFISISDQTRADLHRVGGVSPLTSARVYNGLNHPYQPMDAAAARLALRQAGVQLPLDGHLLHVGGGQWYKNAVGVLALYAAYVHAEMLAGTAALPLWMVSPAPDTALREAMARVPAAGRVHFVPGLSPDALQASYSLASALLFPSLAEGFGWPIVEALSCGCPVLTTDEAPMNEVGGDAALYLPRLRGRGDMPAWAQEGAELLRQLLQGPAAARQERVAAGLRWAARFRAEAAIDAYLDVYRHVLEIEAPAVDPLLGA